MLPNPKNNKNINNLLSNPSVSAEDEAQSYQKKLKFKRKIIVFSLIITAGLSFIFWVFKSIQSIVSSPPQFNLSLNFKLPKLSLPKNNLITNTGSSDLSKFLKKSTANWSVYVSLDTDYSKPVFEYQSTLLTTDQNFNPLLEKISVTKKSSQSLINLSLPQGLFFQEIIDTSSGIYYQGLIQLPKNKILVLIKNNNSIDNSQIQTEISFLINQLYWYAVGFIN